MATKQSTVDYILDQLVIIPNVSYRKMFGEYALYCGSKVVALICGDILFVKITEQGREFVDNNYQEGFAYKGAKPSMQIDWDLVEDREWLSNLILITEENLPVPKTKKK